MGQPQNSAARAGEGRSRKGLIPGQCCLRAFEVSAPSSLGIYLNNNLVAVRFERTKIRLKRAQRIFGPVSRLSALSDPLHEFFLTSDKGLALGNVPIRLGEMPTLLVCHRYSSSRRT